MTLRKKRVLLVICAGAAICAAGLVYLYLPEVVPLLDPGNQCRSDTMQPLRHHVDQYRLAHGGQLLASAAEFQEYFTNELGRPDPDHLLRCRGTGEPLVWRLTEVPPYGFVVVSCAPGSHGRLWKYAWAVVLVEDELTVVKVYE